MPVSNALVSLVKEFISGYVVGLDVPIDEMEVPGEKGVELDKAGGVDFERLKGSTGSTL